MTKLWAVRDALVTVFTTALASASIDAPVINGPRARSSEPKLMLMVGTEGGEDGFGDPFNDSALAAQQPSITGGNSWRDEVGDVLCAAWSWNGTTDTTTARQEAQSVIQACESALLADRTLGGVLLPSSGPANALYMAQFTGLRLREAQGPKGVVARAAFTVSYRALLTN